MDTKISNHETKIYFSLFSAENAPQKTLQQTVRKLSF